MRKLLFLTLFPISVLAVDTTDINCIKLVTTNDGCLEDVLKNYPTHAKEIKDQVKSEILEKVFIDRQEALDTMTQVFKVGIVFTEEQRSEIVTRSIDQRIK